MWVKVARITAEHIGKQIRRIEGVPHARRKIHATRLLGLGSTGNVIIDTNGAWHPFSGEYGQWEVCLDDPVLTGLKKLTEKEKELN
jgi:hypothetical protein